MFRYERRERKLEAKRNRMQKHGRNIAVIYKNVIGKKSRSKKGLQLSEEEVQEYQAQDS